MTLSRRKSGTSSRLLLTLGMVAVAGFASGQSSDASQVRGEPMTIGILPFGDSTASGNTRVGADVGRTMLSEMARSTGLIPRLLGADGSTTADDLNSEKAVVIGREHNVDLVLMGIVVDAKTEESNKSGWIPSIKGQSANVRLRRLKATVTLHGELFDVARGVRLFSGRVTGSESDNAVSGTAYTKFGTWGNDDYRGFLESPLGKALQTAITQLTKEIAAITRSSS